MGRELVTMFTTHAGHKASCPPLHSPLAAANDPKAPDRTRPAGGLRAWCRVHDRE